MTPRIPLTNESHAADLVATLKKIRGEDPGDKEQIAIRSAFVVSEADSARILASAVKAQSVLVEILFDAPTCGWDQCGAVPAWIAITKRGDTVHFCRECVEDGRIALHTTAPEPYEEPPTFRLAREGLAAIRTALGAEDGDTARRVRRAKRAAARARGE